MARQEPSVFKELEAITFELPSKRVLRMPRDEYHPFGSLYSHYRFVRKTWLNDFRCPLGMFQKPALSQFLIEAEAYMREIERVITQKEFSPLIGAMTRLAPALLCEQNHWERFRVEMQRTREAFETEGPTIRHHSEGNARQNRLLLQLHEFKRATTVTTPLQKGLRSVLFALARSVSGRENWKRPLNKWEHGVTVAQKIEFDDFAWTKRACLIHARLQLVSRGRALPTDGSNEGFSRTRIRNRAAIIHEIAKPGFVDQSFPDLLERIKKSKAEGNWEAYLNKLPKRTYPKKTVRSG